MKQKAIIILAAFALAFTAEGCGKKSRPFRVGLVNFVLGQAYIIAPGGGEIPAKTGMPLFQGMKVKTAGKNSLCEIYIRDTAVKLFGDSLIAVDRLDYGKTTGGEETSLILDRGRVFTRIIRKLAREDDFTVKTQTCIAGVRGTEFFVTQGDAKSGVTCLKGSVEVKNRTKPLNAPVVLEGRHEVNVRSGKESVKNEVTKERIGALEKDAEVKPIKNENKEIFDKLDKGDKAMQDKLRSDMKTLSGSSPKKKPKADKKSSVDAFFFKSKN